MDSDLDIKKAKLKKILDFVGLKYKINYKQKFHNKVRDYFIKNLELIKPGLKFIEKELRVAGG